MKNLAQEYINKTSKHLFTNDKKTFMKVIPVETENGPIAIVLKFGKEFSASIKYIDHGNVTSSAGKEYVGQWFKKEMFDTYGAKPYFSIKGGKKYQEMFDMVANSIDKSIDYTDWNNRRTPCNNIKECAEKYFNENFHTNDEGYIFKNTSEKVEKI